MDTRENTISENESLQQLERKYSALKVKLNFVLIAIALLGIVFAFRRPQEKSITLERINIVEPDGKLRMVISNKSMSPGNLFYGKEFIKGGLRSGMIFYNDEETECGGLVFDGKKDSISGNTAASGHLSFDQYNQNQVVYLSYDEDGGARQMGLNIDEWQSAPSFKEWREKVGKIYETTSDTSLQRSLYNKLLYPSETQRAFSKRVFLGRDEDANAGLVLFDRLNRKRLVINVDADGTPQIQFLNPNGKVIKVIEAR